MGKQVHTKKFEWNALVVGMLVKYFISAYSEASSTDLFLRPSVCPFVVLFSPWSTSSSNDSDSESAVYHRK